MALLIMEKLISQHGCNMSSCYTLQDLFIKSRDRFRGDFFLKTPNGFDEPSRKYLNLLLPLYGLSDAGYYLFATLGYHLQRYTVGRYTCRWNLLNYTACHPSYFQTCNSSAQHLHTWMILCIPGTHTSLGLHKKINPSSTLSLYRFVFLALAACISKIQTTRSGPLIHERNIHWRL